MQAEYYRGVVSHKRWLPSPHGFAYELYMVLLDLDEAGYGLTGLWPYASGSGGWAFSAFHARDHMKGHYVPGSGESLAACVRRVLRTLVPGYTPSRGSRLLLLTHLCNFGYTFNPISLYYVVSAGGAVECMLAEVSNTPWNEMHLYPLHPSAPGVRAALEAPGASRSSLPAAAAAAAAVPSPPLPLSASAQHQLLTTGAVAPLDFDGLAERMTKPAAGAAASSSSKQLAQDTSLHLRYTWAKTFHVSPFFGLDHTCVGLSCSCSAVSLAQPSLTPPPPPSPSPPPLPHHSYDWRFSQPNGSTLLVQSANWKDGERVFTTQLMLEKCALTRASLAYMLFCAFPLLTFRIQWWIHYEAFRLWWKGTELFPHPTNARNAFVDAVEGLVLAVMATAQLLSCCCRSRGRAGHGK
jgi:DUF1365 family protein